MDPNRYTLTKFGKEAIDAVYVGVKEVAEAVATTLGPAGHNALLDKGYQTDINHDGVSVSLVVNPKDPFARNGASVMKEATKRMRDKVGDGTSVASILTMAILDETLKATASGINAMMIRRELEKGSEKVIKKLSTLSQPVKTLDQKIQIATISAEDSDLGKMIAETIHKIGDQGVLTVEESKGTETYVEIQEGMQIDKGYVHPFMVTDPERLTAVLEDCYVLITDHSLTSLADIGKFLDKVVFPNTKKVFFIAPDIGVDFMNVLLNTKMQGTFLGIAIRAPGLASMQTDMLQDLCALTGATFITKEAGMKFDDLSFDVLGKAGRIVSSRVSTIITNGGGHKDDVLQRIAIIRKQMEDATLSDYEQEQLKGRLAKLTNGVAVLKVAGMTEVEMKARKEWAIDAIQSTQAACESGMVPGGEIVYLSCLDVLDEKILGEKILKDALKAPFKRLVENAGYDSGEKLALWGMTKAPEFDKNKVGFDVMDGEFKDMIKAGIVDATAIPINAIKTAVSVAVQLSSLGVAIVLENEEKK